MKFIIYNFVITVLSTIAPNADCCSSHVILMNNKHARLMQTRSSQSIVQIDDVSHEKHQWEISAHHRHLRLHHHHRHNQRPNSNTENSNAENSNIENSNKKNLSATADIQFDKAPEYTNILWRKCPPKMDIEFCLNGGQCFDYPISNDSILSCKCPDSFGGERCELKNIDFNHPILYPRVHQIALAKVYLAPLLICFLVCLILYALGLKFFICFSKVTVLRGEISCYRLNHWRSNE